MSKSKSTPPETPSKMPPLAPPPAPQEEVEAAPLAPSENGMGPRTGMMAHPRTDAPPVLSQLVPVEDLEHRVTHRSPLTTCDLTTPEGRRDISAAMDGDTSNYGEFIGQKITITGYTVKRVTLPAETDGEVREPECVILHLLDGGTVGGFSRSLYRSLLTLEALHGPAPWPAGVTVQCERGKGKLAGGRYWLRNLS